MYHTLISVSISDSSLCSAVGYLLNSFTEALNHCFLPDHPANELGGGQFFLLDLLFTNQRLFTELLQCGLRPPDLFGWCAGLF